MNAFLPDRLRPMRERRRHGRRLTVAMLPLALLLLPLWRVSSVQVAVSPPLPASVASSLKALEGRSPLSLDLDELRRQLEAWPGVASVDVRLELPGSLHVTALPAEPVAAVAVGYGWHGVDRSGRLTGALEAPLEPLLAGFRHQPEELAVGLAVAERLVAAGFAVGVVEQLLPDDLQVAVRYGSPPTWSGSLLVRSQPTTAERLFCSWLAEGRALGTWADLRLPTRLVVTAPQPPPDATVAPEADPAVQPPEPVGGTA